MELKDPRQILEEEKQNQTVYIPDGLDVGKLEEVLLEFKTRILAEGYSGNDKLKSDILIALQSEGLSAAPFNLILKIIDGFSEKSISQAV